ncbi:MAG: chemotaxis protein CheC [Hydrogenibacillus sp.]|nr:chemotaxis protein CheC [Hydrogenibacillus sp.]MBE3595913.1 chemotaxis protein CheC [Hydrogenibacillus sp.]
MRPFSAFELDVLREIGNIGAAHATTSLSKLTGTRVDMSVPVARVLSFAEIGMLIGEETVYAATFLLFDGELKGSIVLLFRPEAAKALLRLLLPGVVDDERPSFTELEWSALQEIGNILAGSYLSALSDLTGLKVSPSVPGVALDMGPSILVYGLLEAGRVSDHAVVIDARLYGSGQSIGGQLFLLPAPDALAALFQALGVQAHGRD